MDEDHYLFLSIKNLKFISNFGQKNIAFQNEWQMNLIRNFSVLRHFIEQDLRK